MNTDNVSLQVLLMLGAGLLIALLMLLMGCPQLPPQSDCQPFSTRCSENGTPQTCSGSQRWTDAQDTPCEAPAVCCLTASPYNTNVSACVSPDDCIQP